MPDAPAPQLLSASVDGLTGDATLNFDLEIATGAPSSQAVTWQPLVGVEQFALTIPFAAGTTILLPNGSGLPLSDGSLTMDYVGPGGGLVGSNGTPVAAFADFPYTET